MLDTNKRKIGEAESPLQSKTVSKMSLMEQEEIGKFQSLIPPLRYGIKQELNLYNKIYSFLHINSQIN